MFVVLHRPARNTGREEPLCLGDMAQREAASSDSCHPIDVPERHTLQNGSDSGLVSEPSIRDATSTSRGTSVE